MTTATMDEPGRYAGFLGNLRRAGIRLEADGSWQLLARCPDCELDPSGTCGSCAQDAADHARESGENR